MQSSIRFLVLLLIFLANIAQPGISPANNDPGNLSSTALYKQVAPSVVLLIGKETIGSGSIVNETEILTNWHVIARNPRILVAFKPQEEGARINPDELVVGDVVKTAPDKDLAIVRVKRIPPHVGALQLGSMSEVEIGADVHAIGHPQGEIWTYTKGVISQMRKGLQWRTGHSERFQADVIQTQTPINPGNSGGPLLSSHGRLIGVNSFKARGAEGLNFAVALNEITNFLGIKPSAIPAPPERDKKTPVPKEKISRADDNETKTDRQRNSRTLLYQGRDKDNTGYLRLYSSASKTVYTYYYPDDQARPVYCFAVSDGLVKGIVMDMGRTGKWDYSVLDRDSNGKFETVGLHPDGRIAPSSFLPYTDPKIPAEVRNLVPQRIPQSGSQFVGSPSFDCTKADSLVKQTICGSDTLADMDVTVAALFSRLQEKRHSMKNEIVSGQTEWVRGTEAMCRKGDVAMCLNDRYKQRIIYLNVLMGQ